MITSNAGRIVKIKKLRLYEQDTDAEGKPIAVKRDIHISLFGELMAEFIKKREMIPDEFLTLTNQGLALVVYNNSFNSGGVYEAERIELSMRDKDKPVHIIKCIADSSDKLWTKDAKSVFENFHSIDEFTTKLLPLRKHWIGHTWRTIEDLQYLLLENADEILKAIIKCRNQEIKKHLLKRYGLENLTGDANNVTVIHRDVDKLGNERILFELKLPKTNERHRFVKVEDSTPTGRSYLLEVPEFADDWKRKVPLDTCHKAVAWTFGFEKNFEKYDPVVET